MEDEIFDILYHIYEIEISMKNIRHSHPMFINGTLSEDNSYQPPVPERLMTPDEFVTNMSNQPQDYRWNTAFFALYYYKRKENESFKFLK